MKKSKYQQYFHCFIVCIISPNVFWFSFYQNIVTILISTVYRGATLIRGEALIIGRRLFQCGYPKVRRLLGGGTYQRKYGISLNKELKKQTCGFKFQIIDDAAMAFLRFSISHKYDSRINFNSGLIARKSVKILKRYQKI